MAINTTGNNDSVVGVTGVHPDNIGKGIKWNDTTKKYEVAVSDDAGNSIELRDDGIYQGKTPTLSKYYVSYETGNNSNTGLKDSPLKTIDEVFRRIEPHQDCSIRLKQGETHIITNGGAMEVRNGAHIDIHPYDDVDDDSYRFFAQVTRPVIKFVPVDGVVNGITVFWGSAITFRAIEFDLSVPTPVTVGSAGGTFLMLNGSGAGLNQCVFTLKDSPAYIPFKNEGFAGDYKFDAGRINDLRTSKTKVQLFPIATGDVVRVDLLTEIQVNELPSMAIGRNIAQMFRTGLYTTNIVKQNGVPINFSTNITDL